MFKEIKRREKCALAAGSVSSFSFFFIYLGTYLSFFLLLEWS